MKYDMQYLKEIRITFFANTFLLVVRNIFRLEGPFVNLLFKGPYFGCTFSDEIMIINNVKVLKLN